MFLEYQVAKDKGNIIISYVAPQIHKVKQKNFNIAKYILLASGSWIMKIIKICARIYDKCTSANGDKPWCATSGKTLCLMKQEIEIEKFASTILEAYSNYL